MNRRDFLSASVAFAASGTMGAADKVSSNFSKFKALETVEFLNDGGKVWCFSNRGRGQMLSTVFVSPEGNVLVIDGGQYDDAGFLLDFLRSIGGRVDYWLITHAHVDHYGALVKMHEGRDVPIVAIGELIYNFPERAWCEKCEPECVKHLKGWFDDFIPTVGKNIVSGDCSLGRKVGFGSWSFEILNDPILCKNGAINNTSVCLTVNTGGKRWLVTGDIAVEGGKRLVNLCGDRIRHDVVFMSHHGQNGVNKDFYAAVKPEVSIWPTPDWLWDNRVSKQTAGSGPWKTNYTKCWLQELNIRRQYVLVHDVVFG